MFNSYHAGNHTSTTNINAVTGAILKNHPKSWFEKFHLDSERAKRLLIEGGDTGFEKTRYPYSNNYYETTNSNFAIVVLQMVICGDMQVLAECVYKKDLEKGD